MIKTFRLKFISFPVGRYLSGYFFKRPIPEVLSTEDPDEALILTEDDCAALFHLTNLETRVEMEAVDETGKVVLYSTTPSVEYLSEPPQNPEGKSEIQMQELDLPGAIKRGLDKFYESTPQLRKFVDGSGGKVE